MVGGRTRFAVSVVGRLPRSNAHLRLRAASGHTEKGEINGTETKTINLYSADFVSGAGRYRGTNHKLVKRCRGVYYNTHSVNDTPMRVINVK